jgi:hypothetical protein
MGEEKEILFRGKVCAYLTGRLMGDPTSNCAATFLMGVLLYAQPKDKVGGVGTYDKRKRHPLD